MASAAGSSDLPNARSLILRRELRVTRIPVTEASGGQARGGVQLAAVGFGARGTQTRPANPSAVSHAEPCF